MCGGMASSCWLLLTLSLKGVLAGNWSVHLPNSAICVESGSTVDLPCSYDYPQSSNETRGEGQLSAKSGGGEGQQYKVLSEMWCLEESRCITPRYVFHSAGIFPDPSYGNRVQYLGQPGTKDCSLRITDLRQSDSGTYVFYLTTDHPTEKMPRQEGIQLLVADSSGGVTALTSPATDITEGTSVRLACCSPAASSTALYRWYQSTSATPRRSERAWTIPTVTSGDAGGYYCQIQTGDKVQQSSVLAIDVQYPPRNASVSVSPPGELQDKLPVTLTCSSDANPPVHAYSWYQGEACLPAADRSFHRARQSPATSAGSNPALSHSGVAVTEYGQHCCVARNRHGWQAASVALTDPNAAAPSDSAGSRAVLIGVTTTVLLVIVALVAFLVTRRKKPSSQQSYVLAQTAATEP